jgi:hypothetical protein
MTRAAVRAVRAAFPAMAIAFTAGVLAACGASPAHVGPEGIDELTVPTPSPRPSDFTGNAENAWFPLARGMRWTYRQEVPTGSRILLATVLPGRSAIDGIPTIAVRWQVRDGGATRLDMVRWYAVDAAGNVWWFGQRVAPNAPRLDPLAPRSWTAGVHGAEAGLVLTAPPRQGDGYFNASQRGVVERRSTVETLQGSVVTTTQTYRHVVATLDLSTLAPLHVVRSYYVRGLGLVAQTDTESLSSTISLLRVSGGHPGLPALRTAD